MKEFSSIPLTRDAYRAIQDEVQEYAKWLGMDLEDDQDLFWIAKEGLKAPLPENWKPCKTVDTDEIYYFNFSTGKDVFNMLSFEPPVSLPAGSVYTTIRRKESMRCSKRCVLFLSR